MSSTLSSYKRLLPYARDHDRLLVAQLYLDEQEAKILWLNPRIEELKERQEELAQSILAKEAKLAETLVSTDIPEEQKGGLLEALAPEIQKMKNHLDGLKKRANDHIVAREQAQANLSCRQKVEDLLKMLYSSAFDGETPEFPQEDKLEALVDAAKIECARCLKENMTLKEHGRQVSHMNEVMAKLEKLMELENDPAFEQDTQVADNAPLEARWGEAFKVPV
ncbi:hypothetical protein FS749_014159 [Ceratobasidium sp. UAMH 11750]|nr:hypothetical protein FS749_014159 [Ceratobasidium sp. UAMH 11750]